MNDRPFDPVQAHYEAFPYPGTGWIGFDPHRRAMIDYHSGRCCRRPLPRDARILVAGCGTREALTWALSFPEARVLGIDVSEASLARAAQFAEQLRLTNLTLAQCDLAELPERHAGPYDFISSYGVLHHLPDPDSGLRALNAVLAPGGLMHLMVYNTSNRYWLQVVQSMVDALCPAGSEPAVRGEVAERLLRDLASTEGHRLADVANQGLQELARDRAQFMDAYAHPRERSFDIPGLLTWLAAAGLRHSGWVNPRHWDARRAFADADLLALLEVLPPERAWHLIDQARGPLFEFYAERVEETARPRLCDVEPEMFWQRVPLPLACGGLEVIDERLTGQRALHHAQCEVYPEPGGSDDLTARVWIDEACDFRGHPILLRLLEAIDGRRTMEEIARAVCAAEGVAFEDVRGALGVMFSGLLDASQSIDVDPERCTACRLRLEPRG